ncbi:hypothetical protein TWF225_005655 [Orbilia oligospora]|nr:hypothetical protein TWF225_005655 [Orbilia oligospora]KAF3236583.1 hypothetical protein TWF128_001317 [Orbilia oligospora]KAF3253830.1 hypothetical protein TWF217_007302 [Orbilia oligospora]
MAVEAMIVQTVTVDSDGDGDGDDGGADKGAGAGAGAGAVLSDFDKYPDMIPLSSPTPGNDNIATSDGLEPGSNPPIQMPVSAISTS